LSLQALSSLALIGRDAAASTSRPAQNWRRPADVPVASALITPLRPFGKLAMAALLKGKTVLDPLIRIGLGASAWAWTGLRWSANGMIPNTGIKELIRWETTAAQETTPSEFAPAIHPFR
jgi:hypothetical protein